jgi:hypothetical protein
MSTGAGPHTQNHPAREEETVQITIRHVRLSSLGWHGCLLGVAAAALPSLACGLLLIWGAYLARRWVESWRVLSVKLLGQEIARFDLVHFLGLEQFLGVLKAATAASPLALLAMVVCLALVSGLLLAGVAVLVGLTYNGLAYLTGGIVVETKSRSSQNHSAGDQ